MEKRWFLALFLLVGLVLVAVSGAGCGESAMVIQELPEEFPEEPFKEPELIFLSIETYNPLSVEDVVIDNQEFGSAPEGKITIGGLQRGEHQIIVVINGFEYSRSFEFKGDDVSLSLPEPVTVKVAVWSKTTNLPISDINVFLDEEGNVCTTDDQGICSFMTLPEKYTVRLQGEGIFYEELKSISKDSNNFSYSMIERKKKCL